jgi:hypothetical protein
MALNLDTQGIINLIDTGVIAQIRNIFVNSPSDQENYLTLALLSKILEKCP